jgi:hypothetical protein
LVRDYSGHGIRPDDYDRDVALTVTQFVLSPDVPPEEREHFRKFYLMFSKTMALGNIKRYDIFSLMLAFDEICILMDMGLYDESRQLMGREIMKMQASRSIEGFQTLFGQSGVARTETVQRILRQRSKSSFGGRILGAFRGKQQEDYSSNMPMSGEE